MTGILDGRTALVTGGGRGIGAAIGERLAAAGATVAVSDSVLERAQAVVEAIGCSGGSAYAVLLDVADESSWKEAIAEIKSQSAHLDILVNNAGLTVAKTMEETTLDDWRRVMSVNLEGPFIGMKAALPLMRGSALRTPCGGSIVNMSSVSGIVGTAFLAAYTASKAGLRFLSKSVALDFARKGYRLRVNSVHPGLIEGESAERLFEYRVRTGLSADMASAQTDAIANYPMGHIGLQMDVANGVLFLASDESAFMTGTELVIDGGLSAG